MRIPIVRNVAVAATAALLLAGCATTSSTSGAQPSSGTATSTTSATQGPQPTVEPAPAAAPAITASVDEGQTLEPGDPVSLSLDSGRLASVVLRDETAGAQVADLAGFLDEAEEATAGAAEAAPAPLGATSVGNASLQAPTRATAPAALRTWSASTGLVPGRSYSLSVVAVADGGPSTTLQRTFSVAKPVSTLKTDVSPSDDAVVGVGYPVIVRFTKPVADRAAVEQALRVETSRPIGEAAWSWASSTEVHFRPKTFWPGNTTITVHLDLAGVRSAENVWGTKDRSVTFRTGRALLISIDGKKHRMSIAQDGRVIRRGPTSLGGPGFTTRSGTKVIMSVERMRRMQSETVGITGDDAYDLEVPYAMRMTYSGEFLHGAPWNSRIGEANVSHGCTNLTLQDARWVYENALIGDPVVTTGTTRPTEKDSNGLGAGWNMTWAEWLAGSALA